MLYEEQGPDVQKGVLNVYIGVSEYGVPGVPGVLNTECWVPELLNAEYGVPEVLNAECWVPGVLNTEYGVPGVLNADFGVPGVFSVDCGVPELLRLVRVVDVERNPKSRSLI